MSEVEWREIESTLERMGVEQVQERLEISPVIVGGAPGVDGCDCSCDCTLPPLEPYSRAQTFFNG